MKNIAIILAGGSGSRLGSHMPKQFLEVAGKTILEHSVDSFGMHPGIDSCLVVCNSEWIEYTKELLDRENRPWLKGIIEGGNERWRSSVNALHALEEESDESCVLIHDAVRPCVSDRIISDCLQALSQHDAACTAVRTTDTIMILDSEGKVLEVPPRERLRNSQTPQCFRLGTIRKAYSKGLKDPAFNPTDDCSVVRKYLPETPIAIVEGESFNIKVTYPEDLKLAKEILGRDSHSAKY